MKRLVRFLLSVSFLVALTLGGPASVFAGGEGPGKGKTVVFVTGDDEYRSEEGMPVIADILAKRHGFKCTVLFAINPEGKIEPGQKDNIPGLEALSGADLMVVFTRFRSLPDEQMAHIVRYLDSGKPVIGLRTATHGFAYPADSSSAYKRFGWNNKDAAYEGGFGRQVLGETWINHHGGHGRQATKGLIAEGKAGHPILRGIRSGDIFGPTDVYTVRLPLMEGCEALVLGQVVTGMDPNDPPAPAVEDAKTKQLVDKNAPMMPVAWVRSHRSASGKEARVFTTTMGGALAGKRDWDSEGMRRLLVNATDWCVGLESAIPEASDVRMTMEGSPFKKGVSPDDAWKALVPLK
jgi:hypothetical protein